MHHRRRSRRGVTPIIATIMIVAMTVTAGAILFAFREPVPSAPSQLDYFLVSDGTTPTWGDGSDCSTVNGVQQCFSLPAIDIVFTGMSPSFVPVGALTFIFFCNGTVYLGGPLAAMEWVPGATLNPPANAPQLQNCGTYVPPAAAFNRLVFFEQLAPGSDHLQPGDSIVFTAHTFLPPNCPSPGGNGQCDDDFHGAPQWCYTVVSACSIVIEYATPGTAVQSSVLSIPLYGMSR